MAPRSESVEVEEARELAEVVENVMGVEVDVYVHVGSRSSDV